MSWLRPASGRRHRLLTALIVLASLAAVTQGLWRAHALHTRRDPAARAAETGGSVRPKSQLPGDQPTGPGTRAAHTAPQPPPAAPILAPRRVTVAQATTFLGWALLNPITGAISGSADDESGVSTTESMIKPWIAADYLRALSQRGRQPTAAALAELARMIWYSDDRIAQKYYAAGGYDAVVGRLIRLCQLPRTATVSGWWSRTRMTPADAVRYARCLTDGAAAGPQWTGWLLRVMRQVRGGVNDQQATTGGGRWGIVDALPPALAAQTSIKNGWTPVADGMWHVNCLAINPAFALVVMMRYPIRYGLRYGDSICQSVTHQLVVYPDA